MTQPLGAVAAATPAGPAAAGAGPQAADAKKQGEAFERMLLGQLTKTLVDSALAPDESSSASVTAYKDLLPDALTEALMSGGGIGLAKTLEEGVK